MTAIDDRAVSTQAVYELGQARRDYADVCWFEHALSREEVARVLDLAAAREHVRATIDDYAVDEDIRRSSLRWIHPEPETLWLFDRVAAVVADCNRTRYGFDVTAIDDGIQIADYGPGDFFTWHKDHGIEYQKRKLSVSIQLSDPADYDGGELEFLYQASIVTPPKSMGTMIVFPSYVVHRVTPISRGSRRSAAVWFTGPPFR